MTNPWFSHDNPWFLNENTRFPKKPWFFQTHDEPMTNPWFTHDNPWFFYGFGPFRIGWIFIGTSAVLGGIFGEFRDVRGSQIRADTLNKLQFLIFVGLRTSNYQTSRCWAKVCISRCVPGWGVILETQGFQKKPRVFLKPYGFFGFGGTRYTYYRFQHPSASFYSASPPFSVVCFAIQFKLQIHPQAIFFSRRGDLEFYLHLWWYW